MKNHGIKVAFITTLNHNPGDDFVREGIIYLLERRLGRVEPLNIHKHVPFTVLKGFGWVRRAFWVSRIFEKRLSVGFIPDKILESDLLVQSGAPVYWCHSDTHCADNEWYRPLICERYKSVKDKKPFLNLGAGTCQEYSSNGSEFVKCGRCSSYIQDLSTLATVTTVRDRLAKEVLSSFGFDFPLIPCPSIFALERLKIPSQDPKYICFNYMIGGGHYDFGGRINKGGFWEVFWRFFYKVRERYECVIVCHSQEELRIVRRIVPSSMVFFSRDYREYLKFYAQCKFGIVCRVHSAFALASFGRPSFVIGSDSRVKMVDEIKLHHAFVNDINLEMLEREFERLLEVWKSFRDEMQGVKETAYFKYMGVLEAVNFR